LLYIPKSTDVHQRGCEKLAQDRNSLKSCLKDLLNDDNIGPENVDQDALEKALFDQPDRYNLAETDRVDTTISTSEPGVHRSSTHWTLAEYVRLDSPALAKLISPPKEDVAAPSGTVAATPQATEMPETEDWDVED
jgi:hypothetical protein